jgi:type I restriction enzyme S subunit
MGNEEQNWPQRKLSTCATFQEGYVNPPQGVTDYFGNEVKWLRAVDLNDSFVNETSRRLSDLGFQSAGKAAKLFRPGSLAISKSGTIGRLGILQDAMCGNRAVINIEPHADIDTRFLFYSLLVSRDRIIQLADGSVQKNLYISQLGLLDLRIPAIATQRAIAGVLGGLDDKIEQNRRTSAVLKRMARAMFRAWFVDFEPVKAKAAGATGFPSMPQSIFDALPTRLIDSPVGFIPEGWDVKPIGEVVTVMGGATPSTKNAEFWDGGTHCWATPKDMSRLSDPVLLDTERRITDAGLEYISSGLLPVGTVLLSSRAPVGYLAIAAVPTAVNQGFIAMVCDGPLPPVYVLNWAQASMDAIKGRASGTTFLEISKTAFRPIPVICPPIAAIRAFDDLASRFFDLIASNARECRRLADFRDYLLPRLLSGKTRVRP